MNKIFRIKTLHLLSLDVVLGAILSSWMFWKMPDGKSEVSHISLILLGVSTWIIYIFDRLLDNLKSKKEGNFSTRHQFHSDNQYYLQLLVICLLAIGLALVFFVPKEVIKFGILFSIFITLYFFIQKKISQDSDYQYFKEILTSVLYSVAVVGGAFSMKHKIGFEELLLGFNFFILVHQSIFVFSFYEAEKNANEKNLATKLGKTKSKIWIYLISFWILVSLVFGYWFFTEIYFQKVALVEFMISVVSLSLIIFKDFFQKNEKYRWVGELAFSIPIFAIC